MTELLPHQIEGAKEASEILSSFGLVYLHWEERVGKSHTALATSGENTLIITTKKAIAGWEQTVGSHPTNKKVTIINYHSVHKIEKDNFDTVIIDEAHKNIAGYPKAGAIWKQVRQFTKGRKIIYLSATPAMQSMSQIFWQLKLSDYSPFTHKNFYQWWGEYGTGKIKYTSYGQVKDYSSVKSDDIWRKISHLFTQKTRLEVGFKQEAEDKLHIIKPSNRTQSLLKEIKEHSFIEEYELPINSAVDALIKSHQICGGAIKGIGSIGNSEKIDYLINNIKNEKDYVIFYYYQEEQKLLEKHFTNVYQVTRYSEGVDFSHFKGLIFYSMCWSVAQYSQARNRCCNIKREAPIKVHFLLLDGCVDEQIYNTVAIKKKDFNERTAITKTDIR